MALDNKSSEYRAFLKAVRKGRSAEVEQHLAEHPEFLNLADDHGNRPLHFAALNGRNSIVNLILHSSTLLRSPVCIDSLNKSGWTPLQLAAANGHDYTVELLLQHGSTPLDSADNGGWTSLHFAAWYGHDFAVKLLLQYGSTALDSPNKDGMTPLHFAAWYGQDSTMTILKAVGASTLSLDRLNQEKIAILQAPIPEEEIFDIRYRIYFSRSLLAQLLF